MKKDKHSERSGKVKTIPSPAALTTYYYRFTNQKH